MKIALKRALDAFYAELDMISLNELVDGNTGLEHLFDLEQILRMSCEHA